MSDLPIDPIVLTRDMRASTERAWRALVEPELVARWFTDATPVVSVGAPYRLDFGDSAIVGTVTELVPGRIFGYTWTWEGDDPAQSTRVRWTLEPIPDGGCRLVLRHEGWTAAGLDEATRDDHAGYWAGYLDDLVELLEAEPEPPPATHG